MSCKHTLHDLFTHTHLCDVLMEQRRRAELGQQVEEGGADSVNPAAVKRRQTLVVGQRQLLTSQSKERNDNTLTARLSGRVLMIFIQTLCTCRARTSRIRSTTTSSLASSMLTTANRVTRAW